ncbi:DUF5667 domain-containing protein [Streptomyces sp. NPDC059853]|uniref:DUF5667 domain-containing protein n=1 Tax=Streptomyces sp. NPDC059853 TaxID=3346973 RepID=UPI003651B022
MIGSVPAGRRAQEFAQAVEEPRPDEAAAAGGPDEAPPADRPEQAALLSVADRLTALPRPELSAETKTVQRAQLMAAMETAFAARRGEDRVPDQPAAARNGRGAHRAPPLSALGRLRPRSRLTKGLAAGGLSVGVAAGALGGAAVASTNALPGDTLYGLKRGMEDLRLDFAAGDTARAQLYLDHASTRLHEARRLLDRGRAGDLDHEQLHEIRTTLSSMADNASHGHRLLSRAYEADGSLDPLQTLSSFAEGHRETWDLLRGKLPAQLWDIGEEVTSVFDAMDDEIIPLRSLLPREPEHSAAAEPGTGDEEQDAPSAAETPRTPDSGTTEPPGATEDAEAPQRGQESPPTATEEHQGLLGGTGLLSPAEPTPETDEDGEPATGPLGPLPQPDVTIPPLVQDLLPGLGLDVKNAE